MSAAKKFLRLLSVFVLLVTIYEIGVKAKSKDELMQEKVKQMMDWSMKKSVIRIDGNKFRTYVKAAPRNYSVILMLTALSPNRQCSVCKQASEEFLVVANSWRYSGGATEKLFFAMVDFDDGGDVFQSLKQNSAPVFIHFPAKGKPKKADTMDIHRTGFSGEVIARFIMERTDISIRIFRPPNYSGTLALMTLLSAVGGLVYLKRNSLEFLYNKNFWGILVLGFIFLMTSGQMWNQIRGPPFMHRHPQTGQNQYIHNSSQGQFIVETYLVLCLHAGVVIGMILLNDGASASTDASKRKVMAIAGLILVTLFFSVLLSVFRSKYQGYPYSFLMK